MAAACFMRLLDELNLCLFLAIKVIPVQAVIMPPKTLFYETKKKNEKQTEAKKTKRKKTHLCFVVDIDSHVVPASFPRHFSSHSTTIESFGLTEINEATALLTKINTIITQMPPARAITAEMM